jgi:DNA polymerase-3 subunit alpha
LFAGTSIAVDSKVILAPAEPATMDEKLRWEKNLLALYVSSHPFEYFQKVLEGMIEPCVNLEEFDRDSWIVVGGIVSDLKKKITKRGEIMMFATIADVTGSVELLVFPKTYEKTQSVWQEGNIVCVVGKTPKEPGDNKIFVEKVSVLTKENAVQVCHGLSIGMSVKDYAPQMQEKAIQINLTKAEMKQSAGELKKLFIEHPGDYQVYVVVGTNKIKAQSRIDWNSAVLDELERIVGEGKVEVFE